MSIDLKIYIASHKKFQKPKEDFLIPIHVGKASKEDIGFKGDDTGDSISNKNENYCELTALYWVWKNEKSDFYGLFHYRRYFDIENNEDKFNDIRYLTNAEFNNKKFSKKLIEKYLCKSDIILAKPKVYELSVEQVYSYCHSFIDYQILTETLEELYPEYSKSWYNISYNNNKLIHYNMFIASREIMDKYCEWLFTILFEVEKRVKLPVYDYDKRIFGFMSERLMHLYFTHHNYKVKYLPVLYIKDDKFNYKTPSKIKKYLSDNYKNLIFYMSNIFRNK